MKNILMTLSFVSKKIFGVVIAVLIAALCIFSSTKHYIEYGFENHINEDLFNAQRTVSFIMDAIKEKLFHEVIALKDSNDITDSIINKDYDKLRNYVETIMMRTASSFIIVTDKNGIVLARGHNGETGDKIEEVEAFIRARDGRSFVGVLELEEIGLTFAASTAIKIDGKVVGTIMIGRAFYTHTFVNEIQKITKLDVTVFDKDKRISTTIMRDDVPAVGTFIEDENVRESVLKNGNSYLSSSTILGLDYKSLYWPLKDSDGNILGMLFVGIEIDKMKKIIMKTAFSCLIMTLIISSILTVFAIFFMKSLINPLEKKAFFDKLTGIRNRAGFEGTLSREFFSGPKNGSLILIDLDHFKEVNDNFGHPVGDELLIRTASILNEVFRVTDIIARLGGDEFIVFAPTLSDREVIKTKASIFLKKVMYNYMLKDGSFINVTASLGISISPEDGTDYKDLYHKADLALYKSKENGRNGFTIYDHSMSDEKV